MRNCIFLLCIAAALIYGAEARAHNDRGSVVEGVRWHGHEHHPSGNRVLHDAFGSRNIWGIRSIHIDGYDANRNRLTANGYDDVLVTYMVREDRRRRRRDDRGRGMTVAVGIAHLFSKYRMSEVAIEHFDRSRSRVIDVRDISGVLLTHSRGYGNVTFNERALTMLGTEWQQRFPTDRGQRYRFHGRVAAMFSDNNSLVEVISVRRGDRRSRVDHLSDRPVVLMHGDHLERQRRERDRRRRDRDRDHNADTSSNWQN